MRDAGVQPCPEVILGDSGVCFDGAYGGLHKAWWLGMLRYESGLKGRDEVVGEISTSWQEVGGVREGEFYAAAIPEGKVEQDPVSPDGELSIAAYVECGQEGAFTVR